MEFGDKKLEEKIANIKIALKELGESLEYEDKYQKPQKVIQHSEKDSVGNSFVIRSASPVDKLDLKMFYNYEKEKNSMLEVRILHKDELLTEMTFLQNELYANIDELQNTVGSLKSDLEYTRNKVQELSNELEKATDLVKMKDFEISKLSQEKEQYYNYLLEKDEESKLLNEELNSKEPDKRLFFALEKRNQELLLEIDELQHHLQQINTNQLQVLNLQDKLRKSEEDVDCLVKNHAVEVTALMQKINTLEFQMMRVSNENVQNKISLSQEQNFAKFKQNYNELMGILSETEHQAAVSKLQSILSKSLENTKQSNLKENFLISQKTEDDQVKLQENTKIEHKLYQRLADLMVQCAPKDKFSSLPTCSQVWKWVTRILEDYMTIKKELSSRNTH